MFEFRNVKFKDVIDIPSLYISEHRITSLTGPSGSGKTTILKLLNKILSPTEGQILYRDRELDKIDAISHRRKVTMLSQTPVIFGGNLKDELTAGLRFQKKHLPDDETLIEVLKKVRLTKELNSETGTLSGGEKQRLALARILLLDPEVFLLDEPSSALDDTTAEAVIEMIASFTKAAGKTLIMVTHSMVIAERYSDQLIEISANKPVRGTS